MSNLMLEELRPALDAVGCRWEASEAHGTLIGLACAEPRAPVARWVAEIERDGETPSSEALGHLDELGRRGVEPIRSDQFDFQPLLPDDDEPIAVRTAALAQWCQGFLYGVALTGQNPARDGPGDVPEVMADLAEITKADAGAGEPADEVEAAYAELVEFVRVAVQLVYDELATGRPGTRGSEDP